MGKEGDKTKIAIRKAALVLLVQKGFRNVTVKDIYEAAGFSRGGLYTHYGGTGQVFAGTINELMLGLKSQVAEKMERGLPAALISDGLLERYQSEILDRSGSLGLAFYEYYSGMPLSKNNAMLKQYCISETMLYSLIKHGTDKSEFKQANANTIADLLLFSYQSVRILNGIMPLDDDNIPKGMISEIGAMLVK